MYIRVIYTGSSFSSPETEVSQLRSVLEAFAQGHNIEQLLYKPITPHIKGGHCLFLTLASKALILKLMHDLSAQDFRPCY